MKADSNSNNAAIAARCGGPLLLAVTAAIMLAWTWNTWQDSVIDFGREMYLPWRITQGDVLYRDMIHFNGPLSPYFNALLFRCFGVSIRTLVFANLCILAVITVMLYRLLARAAGRFAATAALMAFLLLFAFVQYLWVDNFNFVTPYSHELTHGLLLILIGIAILRRHYHKPSNLWPAAAGLTLGLAFLTKSEIFTAALLSACVGWLLVFRAQGVPLRRALQLGGIIAATMLIPPAIAWLLLNRAMPASDALQGVLGAWPWVLGGSAPMMDFFRRMSGWDNAGRNILYMLATCAVYAALLGAAALADLRMRTPLWRKITLALGGVFIFAALTISGFTRDRHGQPPVDIFETFPWDYAFRPLPLVALTVLVVALRNVRNSVRGEANAFQNALAPLLQSRDREGAGSVPLEKAFTMARSPLPHGRGSDIQRTSHTPFHIAIAAFATAALAMLLKMLLSAHLYAYGFAHAMPAMLLFVLALTGWLPQWVRRRGGRGGIIRATGLTILAAAVTMHLFVASFWIRTKTLPLGRGPDRFLTDVRAGPMQACVDFLKQNARPHDTLAVFPEGMLMHYLSGLPMSQPYYLYTPPQIQMFGEDRMLQALRDHPPEWVILVDRPTPEYFQTNFGINYAQQLYHWLQAEYRPARLFGGQPFAGRGFGVWLLHRRL